MAELVGKTSTDGEQEQPSEGSLKVVGVKQELWPIDTKLESEDAHRVVGFATAEHDGASRDRAKQDSKHTRKEFCPSDTPADRSGCTAVMLSLNGALQDNLEYMRQELEVRGRRSRKP